MLEKSAVSRSVNFGYRYYYYYYYYLKPAKARERLAALTAG